MAEGDFSNAKGQTVVVTGAAGGIGAETAHLFHEHGANVVIADLPGSKDAAEALIAKLSTERAIFVPTNILSWSDMLALFKRTKETFGRIDTVIANAGIMESNHLFELAPDENGDPVEPKEHHRVIDVNVKGTLNTLTMAMHYMKLQEPLPGSQHRGSIVLIISTSGYFGGSGVMAYVTSKHGVTGMFRACQKEATKNKIRVNAVAPNFTPTQMTGGFAQKWQDAGLPANTPRDVANAIAATALGEKLAGNALLAAGARTQEIEAARSALVPTWLGEYMSNIMAEAGKFFESTGGYILPKTRS